MPRESGELRADAQANRDRLIDVARDAFAASPDASLNSIARAAGVGAGTLYRHFPSREALVLAVYRKEIQALVDLAPALAARHPPLEAFRRWCDRLADYGRIKQGLAETIHAAVTDRDHQETYGPMVGAIAHLVDACQRAGEFRPDVDAEDLLVLLGFLWRIAPGSAGEGRARRTLSLVVDGLRKR